MNISSTPFIRNDYWPDYNDINQLNQRINEVENELSLTNIRLSANIENVSNDLNSYANNQANTTIANNIIVNNINANYAVGKFVNFGNANFDNAYVENLTVNKPVFDITLNTPHIENVTSLGGNIYDANMFNVSITGGNVAFNSVSIDDLTASNVTISNVNILDGNVNLNKAIINDINASNVLISNVNILDGNVNLNKAIINDINTSNAVISNVNILDGNININKAVIGDVNASNATISNVNILDGDVNLNKAIIDNISASNATISNVNILDGNININKAVIGDINASNATISNLFVNTQSEPVTSSAVLGYDSEGRVIPIHASYDVGFPEDANYLFTDHAGTAFAGVAATEVSTVNNLITAQAVQNGFNDINANVQNGFNNLANNLAETEQIDMNNIVSSILPYAVVSYFNSSKPLNYQGITDINYNAGSFTSPYYLGNNVYMRLNGTTLEFSLPATVSDLFYTGSSNMYIPNNNSMLNAFVSCTNLDQNILIPNSVTNMQATFKACSSLNQNILIPNSVTSMIATFSGCRNLNQNILIPNSVTNIYGAFWDCTNLNQNILIPNSVTNMSSVFGDVDLDLDIVFHGCTNLNQNILIPNSVTIMSGTFGACTNLNQNILIPNSVTSMSGTFMGCVNLNQNIYIYSDILTNMYCAFNSCGLLADKYIHIRSSIPMGTSNVIYNSLVNNYTGVNWTGRIINDLEEPTQWPPEV